ncbi:unnamed protein product [Leptosia nina]|uniref:Major facilitator superfamily (MFS) profile domain-containing protein n=1 Tax=Leptosia nina TaxID=320188 RepID=A0AAV1JG97_9NEOP
MESGRKLQYVVTTAVSLLTTAMGIFSAWRTPMISKIWANETKIHIDDEDEYKILLMTPIGFYIGVVFAGFCCDGFGRRTTILISAVIFEIGTVFAAFGIKVWMLCAMEFFWQFATGMLTVASGIYLAEIADPDIRGRLVVVTRVTFSLGNILILSIGPKVSYEKMNYWLLLVAPLAFVACYPIPESPYYHLRKNNEEAARREFARIRENEGTETIQTQFNRLKSHTSKELEDSKSFFKCLIKRRYTKAIIATFGMKLIYLLSGTVAIQSYYSTVTWESDVVLSVNDMFKIYMSIRIIIGLASAVLVDKVGRRPLYMSSFIGSSICLFIMAIYFLSRDVLLLEKKILHPFANVRFAALIIFIITSSFGVASLTGLTTAEMYPLNVRTKGVVGVNLFAALGFAFGKMMKAIRGSGGDLGVFCAYGTGAAIGCVFTYFCLPETKDKSLNEIREVLQGKSRSNGVEMTSREA